MTSSVTSICKLSDETADLYIFFGTRQERILSHLRLKCSHANLDNIGMYTAINRLGFGDDTEVQHRLTLNIGPPARHALDSARRCQVFQRRTPGVLLKTEASRGSSSNKIFWRTPGVFMIPFRVTEGLLVYLLSAGIIKER